MSTVATAPMKVLARGWEKDCGYRSARCSGIVGDLEHRRRGGPHISRQDQPRDNWSVIRPQDRPGNGPDDASAGIDMTMNTADMILCTQRLRAVWANKSDPRRKYLNAFNGYLGGANAQRFDIIALIISWATPDHKWHCHLELRRLYTLSMVAVKAILSALKGETVEQYLRSIGAAVSPARKPATPPAPTPAPKPAPPKAPPYPGRVLQRNDRQARADPAVRQWQQRMLQRGWRALGSADGFFGAKTESVVRQMQAHCKVAVDGRIGPVTWPLPWTDPLG